MGMVNLITHFDCNNDDFMVTICSCMANDGLVRARVRQSVAMFCQENDQLLILY